MHNTNIELQNSHPLHHQLLHQDRMSTQDLLYISVDASRLQTSCYKTSRYQQSVSDTCCTIQTLSFKTHITPPPTHLRISTTAYHSHEVIKTTITLMPAQPPAISWQALYMLTTQHRSPFLPYPIVPFFPFHPTPYHHA